MITWYQNLAKEDNKRWPHFRGLIARDWNARRKLRYEVATGLRGLGFSVDCYGGDACADLQFCLHFLFVSVFITLESALGWFPKDKRGRHRQPMTSGLRFGREGFYVHLWNNAHEWANDGSTYLINWHYDWPWIYASASVWEVQREDGSFAPKQHEYPDRGKEFEFAYLDGRKMYQAPYRYILRSGEVQNVTATFFVDRMVWYKRYQRWSGLSWAKWPKIDRKSINISFSHEVGERAGSWKGGTIGCGYEMLPGEAPLDTLKRMEQERKFA